MRRGYWSMPDKGEWDPAAGVFPANPSFGDTWTAASSGTVNGLAIAAGQTITFNRLADAETTITVICPVRHLLLLENPPSIEVMRY